MAVAAAKVPHARKNTGCPDVAFYGLHYARPAVRWMNQPGNGCDQSAPFGNWAIPVSNH